jgi:hypothetical protein
MLQREMRKCTLSGMICPGRRWKKEEAHFFEITFHAYVTEHAKKIALERLKAFVKREKKDVGASKVILNGVAMRIGKETFPLNAEFCNNSILYATRSKRVFN